MLRHGDEGDVGIWALRHGILGLGREMGGQDKDVDVNGKKK